MIKAPAPLKIRNVFPDPKTANADGIVGFGGDLEPSTLFEAYSKGIFPWPHEGYPLLWFSLDPRAILFFEELHIPRSLQKLQSKSLHTFSINKAFAQVLENCSKAPRPGQKGTWITNEMKAAYIEFHRLGYATSIEVWDQNENLVGGIYGVYLKKYFSAESMFYLTPNASKLALLHLIDDLKAKGHTWLDVQMLTPHIEKFGAREIPRNQFLTMIKES